MVGSSSAENLELLAAALVHLGEGVMITDNCLERPGPLIIYVNPAMSQISGYKSEEILNHSPRMFQGPETDRATLDHIKRELSAGKATSVEVVNYRKNGEPFYAELYLSPIFDELGNCTNYVSIVRDLTARKKLTDALHAREQHLNAILNTAIDAIITIDERGAIVSANRAAGEMFGYGLEELLGRNVSILMPEPFRREHDQYIRNYLVTGNAKIIGIGREVTGKRKDGSLFPIDLAISQVGDSKLFTGFIRDLTSRRELQQQILEIAGNKQREIGHRLHEGIGQDLTGIHLLSNTLVQLIGSNLPGNASKAQPLVISQRDLQQIHTVASRISVSVAAALKNVTELCRGVMPVQLDSQGLMVALLELSRATAKNYGVECVCRCEHPVEAHNSTIAAHVYQIIRDAVENAAHHPDIAHIQIRIDEQDEEVLFEVTDDATHLGVSGPQLDVSIVTDVMAYRSGMIGAHIREQWLEPRGHSVLLRVQQQILNGEN